MRRRRSKRRGRRKKEKAGKEERGEDKGEGGDEEGGEGEESRSEFISAKPAVTQSADDPSIKVRLMVGNDPGRQQDGRMVLQHW